MKNKTKGIINICMGIVGVAGIIIGAIGVVLCGKDAVTYLTTKEGEPIVK